MIIREMLKQQQNAPISVEEQVAIIYAGINGFLDDIAVEDVKGFIKTLRTYLRSSVPAFLSEVKSSQKLSPENEEVLKKAIGEVKAGM